MTIEEKEELLEMIKYFYKDKGDITRYAGYEEHTVRKEFPVLMKAYDDMNNSIRIFEFVLSGTRVEE